MVWNSFAFISFICFLLSGASAALSFASRKKGAEFLYGMMSVVLSLWSFGLFMCLSAPTGEGALFWSSLANYIVLFLPALIFHFVSVFVGKETSLRRVVFIYYLVSVAYFLLILRNPEAFLHSPTYRLEEFWFPMGGTLFYFFPILFTLVGGHAIHILCISRTGKDKRQKLKIDYMLGTIIIGLLGGGLSISLEFGIDIPPYGILSVALMVMISTYAVLRHDLLELPETLSIIAARSMTYVCVFALMVLALEVVNRFSLHPLSTVQTAVVGLLTVLASEIYVLVRGRIQSLSDRLLIKQKIDHDKSFRTLIRHLELANDFEEMLPALRNYFEAQSYVHHYAWYLDQALLEHSLKNQSAGESHDSSDENALVCQRILFSRNDGRRHDRLPSLLRVDVSGSLESTSQVVKLMSSEQLDSAYSWVDKVPGREMIGLPLIASASLRGMLLVVVSPSEMSFGQQSSLQFLTGKLAQIVERFEMYREKSIQEQVFLMDKMESLQALAASIAHEMKLPLSQLSQFVFQVEQQQKMLETGASNSLNLELHRKQANLAIERSSQAIDITLGLLRNSPIDASEFKLLSVQSLVSRALADYVFLPGERDVVESDLRQNFILKGDESLLIYAIFNILKTALSQVGMQNGARLHISSELESRTNVLAFRVVGVPVAKELLPKLFDDYFCNNASEEFNLGLAYCQRVMNAFGGDVDCLVEDGEYTEFRLIFLPVAESSIKLDREVDLQAS